MIRLGHMTFGLFGCRYELFVGRTYRSMLSVILPAEIFIYGPQQRILQLSSRSGLTIPEIPVQMQMISRKDRMFGMERQTPTPPFPLELLKRNTHISFT